MILRRPIFVLSVVALLLVPAAEAQNGLLGNFQSHNQSMTALQPAWMVPLVASDARLLQFYRMAMSHQYAPAGTPTNNFGNSRGMGIILNKRLEMDFMPPAYVEHNSTARDGFGDTTLGGKVRLISGNAERGNFIVSAIASHTFPTGSYKNGAASPTNTSTLAGGLVFAKKFDVQSSLGATLPTGNVTEQGRPVAWSTAWQYHFLPKFWLDIEDNSTFYHGGEHDGSMQNFITPALMVGKLRRAEWKPTHPFFVVDGGTQIATSRFHTMNHNLILEAKLLF